MISKELFVKCLNNIKKQEEKRNKFNDALEEMCDGFPVFDCNNLYLESLVEILNEEMDSMEDDTIGWWLWENVEKVIYIEGIAYDVSTPELLYDFLDWYKNYDG